MPLEDLEVARIYAGPARCPACRYRLTGQPERDDERLGITLVRCPECGEIRTVHDPERRVSRSGRPRFMSGRGVLIVILMLIHAGVLGGFAQSVGVVASADVARYIGSRAPQQRSGMWSGGIYSHINTQWWNANRAGFMTQAFNNGERYHAGAIAEAAWPAISAVIVFTLIVGLAPALRTRWLVAIAGASALLAAIGLAAYYADSQAAFGYEYALTLAEWQGGWVYGAIALGIGAASTGTSALAVRPCLRSVLGFINRGPIRSGQIAALWVADAKSGPGVSEAAKPAGDD